jgi:ferredoxin
MWRLDVDKNVCIGAGSCAGLAADHFAQDDDGLAYAVAAQVHPDDVLLDAAAACPMQAITLVDLESGAAIEP